MMKRRATSEPLYQSEVLFLIGGTEAEAEKAARKWMSQQGVEWLEAEDDGPPGEARTFRGTMRHFVIWCAERNADCLSHEISHVGVSVMHSAGIPITPECDEPLAHYIGWLAREASR